MDLDPKNNNVLAVDVFISKYLYLINDIKGATPVPGPTSITGILQLIKYNRI